MFIKRKTFGLLAIPLALVLLMTQVAASAVGISADNANLTIIDDFNDGDASDWLFFDGDNAGGGGGAATDRPYEGSGYLSTGWGSGAPSGGYFGGAFRNFDDTAQIELPDNAEFSVWVYNQSDATSNGYTLEITIREDVAGDGWDGFGGADDSFRYDTQFSATNYNDEWVQISAPVSDFFRADGVGDGEFNGKLDEIVIVIAGVQGATGVTVEVDFDQFALTEGEPPAGPVGLIDNFNDGDSTDWFCFNGEQGGGCGGAESDRPYEGSSYLSTGWGGIGEGGFYGGMGKNFADTAQVALPERPEFSVWVLNQSDATSDGFILEITIREDVGGDGWDGLGSSDESFRLDTTFTSADYNDQWVNITAPIEDFALIDGSGDGTFNGNLDEIVFVIAGVQGADGASVEVDFDLFEFVEGAAPPVVIDDFNDGDATDWFCFNGDQGGGCGGGATDRPYEGDGYYSTGWGGIGGGGFYGGTGKNFADSEQIELPSNPAFSVWVYNQSDATSTGYTIEITIREDVEGNGWNGFGGTDESFRLDTVFNSADYNDQWVQITAPVADFGLVDGSGDGEFTGNLDEIVVVIAGVEGADGATVEVDFDQFAFIQGPSADVVIDDFNDDDATDWTCFNGEQGGGCGGAETDRPYEGLAYFSTGWGGIGEGGFYGGAFKNFVDADQPTPTEDTDFSVWVYNESSSTSTAYTLEITIREDVEGNGWNGLGGTDESFRLDTRFTSADYNDQWVQVTAPLSAFNLVDGSGGNGAFNGGLDEIVIVIAGVEGADGATVNVDFDYFAFVAEPLAGGTTVSLGSNQYNVPEGGDVEITAELSSAATETVTVMYATSDGTAVAGSDYTMASGELTFDPGETTKSFTVMTSDNSDDDDDRTFVVALSNPVNAGPGLPSSAVVTILDDEATIPTGKGTIIEDYEGGELVSGEDADGNVVGYEFFLGGASTVELALTTTPPAPVPGSAEGNTVLQEDLFITAGSFSGFSYKFTNEAADEWVPQDWSSYAGIGFWLYGNNTGGVIFIDIQDNRNAGSTTDDAGRYSIDLQDNFEGWQYFELMFDDFRFKPIGNGAPNDGFTLDEIHGYAFGGFGSQPIDNSYYIDDVQLITRVDVVDNFELDMLSQGQDADGVDVGYLTFSGNGGGVNPTLTDMPAETIPGLPEENQVLALDMVLPTNGFAGFTHAFTNDEMNEWVPENWIGYEGVCFWLYGHDTGGVLFLDILDNRNSGSMTDDAERYSVDIPDNFSGWQFFQISWDELSRKDVGNGAPNDGLNLNEVHGYAIGGFGSVDMGQNTYYVDNFSVWGSTGLDQPLEVEFADQVVEVTEGETVEVTIELNRPNTTDVAVGYVSAESFATPDRDFIAIDGSVTILAGETTATFMVETIEDDKPERDETLAINLTSATGAEFGFSPRMVVKIFDDDAVEPLLVDDYEEWHPFAIDGNLDVSVTELAMDDALAIPGQGAYEYVTTVDYGMGSLTRTFTEPADWSGATGVELWYYGTGSGDEVKITILDNAAATTGEVAAEDWVMNWSDEFDDATGTQPDQNTWTFEVGDGSLNEIVGWGNSESQFYTDDPANAATDGDGNLVITLDENTDPSLLCWYGPCEHTSARIITRDKLEVEYGKLEARIKVPAGGANGVPADGLWPAFWTLGDDIDEVGWPQTGEIDIMETVSRVPNEVFGTIHGPGYFGGESFGNTWNFPEPVSDNYHTFTIEWMPEEIKWYVDGIHYHTAVPSDVAPNEWVFEHPFFLLLNLAIGGNFGGTIGDDVVYPQMMYVDYVRYYGAEDTSERFETTIFDNHVGWKKLVIPFGNFERSATQPDGAPDDGMTMDGVMGYEFSFEEGDAGNVVTHFDQLRLITAPPTDVALTQAVGQAAGNPVMLIAGSLLAVMSGLALLRRKQVSSVK